MSKRDGYDIVGDMLVALRDAKGKLKPTQLMYKANLSYPQLKKYLTELLDKKLVKQITEKNHNYIAITDTGYQFVVEYQKAKAFEESFGLEF